MFSKASNFSVSILTFCIVEAEKMARTVYKNNVYLRLQVFVCEQLAMSLNWTQKSIMFRHLKTCKVCNYLKRRFV